MYQVRAFFAPPAATAPNRNCSLPFLLDLGANANNESVQESITQVIIALAGTWRSARLQSIY